MRILIIDDNPADVNMISEIFESVEGCAYKIQIINNGDHAMDFFSKAYPYEKAIFPNLIILDLNLPGRSGHEILQYINKLDIRIPVIVYTTSDRKEDIKKAYQNYASCYVCKPSDFTQLNRVLRLIAEFWINIVKLPE